MVNLYLLVIYIQGSEYFIKKKFTEFSLTGKLGTHFPGWLRTLTLVIIYIFKESNFKENDKRIFYNIL